MKPETIIRLALMSYEIELLNFENKHKMSRGTEWYRKHKDELREAHVKTILEGLDMVPYNDSRKG